MTPSPPRSDDRQAASHHGGAPDLAILLPDFAGGGAERAGLNLAGTFAARGMAVTLVVFANRGPLAGQVPAGVRVVDLGCLRARGAPRPLARYLDAARPGVLLSFMLHANVAAAAGVRLARHHPRLVWSVQNMPERIIGAMGPLGAPAFRVALRALSGMPARIVTVSHGVGDALAALFPSLASRIVPIYNPVVDFSRVPPRVPRAPGAAPMVLAVGRLAPQKNYPLLLEAFALLRRGCAAELVILGEGPDRAALERQALRLGIADSLRMPGFVNDPLNWMARADVFAMSSSYEGLANVLPEAMAVGVPIVSTDWPPSAREVLAEGRWGRIVPPGDAPAFAAALRQTIAHGGPDARARAADFAIGPVCDAYARVLFGPLNDAPPPPG